MRCDYVLSVQRLDSERLILRGFEQDDFSAYADYHQNVEVYRFLYQEPPKGDALRHAFDAQLGRSFEADGDALHLAVVVKEGGDLVGEVILKLASKGAAQGEVGYIFNPSFAGRGYATEALRRLVTFAFEELHFHRLFARLDAKNHGSAGVVERLKFRREAHLIENLCFNGTWGDEYISASLKWEWGG